MSELHKADERPQQYRVPCENCGDPEADKKRMHSYLRRQHLRARNEKWRGDVDQVQCNACGEVRTVE